MSSLWVGSDVDLRTLHQHRMADRLQFRLACLHLQNSKTNHNTHTNQEKFNEYIEKIERFTNCEDDDHFRRRRRSGTWP